MPWIKIDLFRKKPKKPTLNTSANKIPAGQKEVQNLLIICKATWKLHALNVKLELSWVPGEIGVCHFISSLPKPRCRIRMVTRNWSLGVWMRIDFAGNTAVPGWIFPWHTTTYSSLCPPVYLVHSQVAVCLLQFNIQEVFEGDVHGPILFHWWCLKAKGFGREIRTGNLGWESDWALTERLIPDESRSKKNADRK